MVIIYDQSYFVVRIMEPKKIGAAKFKEQCLSILDNLEPDGVIVTKHGKPVAKVTPIKMTNKEFLDSLDGRKVIIKGDIMSTGVKWNAES